MLGEYDAGYENCIDSMVRQMEDMQFRIDNLHRENAKLREELEQWHRLTAGIELPEYPITEFKPKDLERENAKLRELVKHLNMCNFYTSIECAYVHCWECPYDNNTGNCDFDGRMHELGIEIEDA